MGAEAPGSSAFDVEGDSDVMACSGNLDRGPDRPCGPALPADDLAKFTVSDAETQRDGLVPAAGRHDDGIRLIDQLAGEVADNLAQMGLGLGTAHGLTNSLRESMAGAWIPLGLDWIVRWMGFRPATGNAFVVEHGVISRVRENRLS